MARVRCTPAGGARICRCCSSACATGCVQACEVEQPSTSRAGEAHQVANSKLQRNPTFGRPQPRGSPRRPKVGAHQLSLHLPHSQLRKVVEQGVLSWGEGARPEVEDAVRSRQESGRRAGESASHFRAPPPGASASTSMRRSHPATACADRDRCPTETGAPRSPQRAVSVAVLGGHQRRSGIETDAGRVDHVGVAAEAGVLQRILHN